MDGVEPSIDDLKRCIRKGTIASWTSSLPIAVLRLKTKVYSDWYWMRLLISCPTRLKLTPSH